ncbi:MAG: response regulator [Blastocatellales bacterium]|nr:response regulator [Blastocatellales bacterium]
MFERRADEFDGVVLDLSMPNMNGFAAFNEIRRRRPNTRVILSSGYTEQEATQQFIGRGLSAFLQKPYDLQSLKNTLSDVLQSC